MISKYERIIIEKLLDKYEKSKSFTGANKLNQKFSIKLSSLFSNYTDHSNYEKFHEINEAIDILVRKQLIIAKSNSAKVYNDVVLNVVELEKVYEYINRMPKKDVNKNLLQFHLRCYHKSIELI